MSTSAKALFVHFFTATGAVFATLALLEATKGEWAGMYFWLLIAFIVDGIDGPLARRYEVNVNAPQYDGALMDLIIDYLTYVFIPAYALFDSGLLPGWTGWFALLVITFTSVIYFADTRMKTVDKSFSGFPGCWNMVVLVMFALEPPWAAILSIVVLLTIALFLPCKFVHPVRTARWRPVTLPVALAWTLLAIWAAWINFALPLWAQVALALASLYLTFAGILQETLFRIRKPAEPEPAT